MAQYIPKSALVAEIEKHFKYATNGIEYAQMGINKGLEHYKEELAIWQHCQSMCHHILSFVNSLEVKEVDLKKELESWRHNHFHGRRDKEASGEYLERVSQLDLARHFFELGLKAQKGE